MELQIVSNRIGVHQVRLVDIDNEGAEMMRSEPMPMREARALAAKIGKRAGLVIRRVWEGPKK